MRNQLLHAMAEQQNLMDALTAVSSHSARLLLHSLSVSMGVLKDVVKLQEENSSLKSGFQQLEHTTTQQTKTLKV